METRSAVAPTSVWRSRDFRLLASGRLISQLGDQFQFLALPLLVVALTGATQAGLVLGIQTVVFLVFGLVAGALVDRWDRKRTMIWCEVARGLAVASIPVASALAVLGMPQLYLVAVVNGLLSTLFSAANSSALPNIVAPGQLPSALGGLSVVSNGLRLVGAPIAGVLYSFSRMLPFAFNAVSFFVSAVSLLLIRPAFQRQSKESEPSPWALVKEIREGLSWLARKPVVRTLALLDAGDSLRYGAGYLLIIMLAAHLNATATQIGIVFMGAAAGALVGSIAAPKLTKRFPLGLLSIAMLWAEALAFPFYAMVPTWWLLLVVAFAESTVSPVYGVALDTYRLSVTPDDLRGRVTSAVDTLVGGGAALGTAASGVVIAWIGAPALTFVLTGWLVMLALVATLSKTVRSASASAAA